MSHRFLTTFFRDKTSQARRCEASHPLRLRASRICSAPLEVCLNDNAHPPQTLQRPCLFYNPTWGLDRSTVASPPLRNRHRAVCAPARLVLRSHNCVSCLFEACRSRLAWRPSHLYQAERCENNDLRPRAPPTRVCAGHSQPCLLDRLLSHPAPGHSSWHAGKV
jgi:hypothetical protein